MKNIKILLLICFVVLLISVAYAYPITIDGETTEYTGPEVNLVLNNQQFTPSVGQMPPIIIEDRTLVPVREVFENLGGTVNWDNNNKAVTISMNDTTIKLTINRDTAFINGKSKKLDVPAKIINDKTMVPVRFISENCGLTVEWDNSTKTVTIYKPEKIEEVEVGYIVPEEPLVVNGIPYAAKVFNDKIVKNFGEKKEKNTTYQLCDIIITNNTSNVNHKITLKFINEKNETVSSDDMVGIYDIKRDIIQFDNATYKISGEYDEEGYISTITIERTPIKSKYIEISLDD